MAGQFNEHQSQHLAALLVNLGAIAVTGAEVNTLESLPFDYTFTPVAGAANTTAVSIQAKDANGANISHVVPLLVWLSDSAAGEGLTSTTPSGNVTAGASGTILSALTAKKAFLVHTSAAGLFILGIIDTDKHEYVVCAQSLNGEILTTDTLEAADYGA
jgi:hypothetical protein